MFLFSVNIDFCELTLRLPVVRDLLPLPVPLEERAGIVFVEPPLEEIPLALAGNRGKELHVALEVGLALLLPLEQVVALVVLLEPVEAEIRVSRLTRSPLEQTALLVPRLASPAEHVLLLRPGEGHLCALGSLGFLLLLVVACVSLAQTADGAGDVLAVGGAQLVILL